MVSIIMPVYNVEKYIAKCIESVLNQHYKNFELIIIDDGSLDESITIAQNYKDERIKIFHKENGGLSDARNYGMQMAVGDYIYFLDSDDWIEANLIDECVTAMNKYETDFVVFGYYLDNENANGKLIDSERKYITEKLFSIEKKNLIFDENILGLLGYAWNKLYKAEFLKTNSIIFDKGISLVEDILFNTKVYEQSERILFIENTLYHYINRPSASLIKKFHKDSFELNIKKTKSLSSFLEKWKVERTIKNDFLSYSLMTGIRYCVNNLFAFENGLKMHEKMAYIRMMLYHEETLEYIPFYKPVTFNDKMYKKLIINKAVLLLYMLCQIKK